MNRTTFPRLYHKGSTGALFQWDIYAEGDTITTIHGQVDGKLQASSKKVEAKNVGRSNATTVAEQAVREAKAMWQHKLDRKYSETPEQAAAPLFLPMLAHDFTKRSTGIVYPVFVQPKLDGFRCLAAKEDGVVTLYSRSGDTFDLPHISEELASCLPDGTVVDGELYCHKTPFQKIASWIKKNHPETNKIGYHIYDVPEMGNRADLTMEDRVKLMDVMDDYQWDHVDIVQTVKAFSKDEVYTLLHKFIRMGYEGIMVRLLKGLYRYGYRSSDLLKCKVPDSDEFCITGGRPGVGKMAKHCIFECVTEEGKKFSVVPIGNADERAAYLRELKCYIGRMLTVKHFGFSSDGVPRFPIGTGVREPWDV